MTQPRINRWLIAALAITTAPATALAQMNFQPRPLAPAPEGPFSLKALPNGYSHVALLTWPQIKPADLADAPKTAARYAQMFGVVLLADVRRDPANPQAFKLNRLAVGQTMREGATTKIITPKSDGVSFIASQVLASGAKELQRARQIASYGTAVLFDAPSVMVRGGVHQELMTRHFIWTNSKQGGLATAIWLVDNSRPLTPRLVDSYFVQIPDRFEEHRTLSVDKSKFNMLGMPGKTAFAFEQLPAGNRYAFNTDLAQLAVQQRFNEQSLIKLAVGLSQVIATGKPMANVAAAK